MRSSGARHAVQPRGAATASAGFGSQGEGAIEGVYLDYRRARLDAHAASSSPYNRFEGCGVEAPYRCHPLVRDEHIDYY